MDCIGLGISGSICETTMHGETPICFVLKGNYLLRWTLLGAACPIDNVVISVSYAKKPHI